MARFNGPKQGKKLIWRITAAAPLGEFVDPDAEPRRPPTPDESAPERGGWVVSSFDLKHGADVSEGSDTVPGDLYDELFAPSGAAPNSGGPG